jgi:transcriptional regulator with XRE-family HTH domain
MNITAKNQAVELRKEGLTYKEIKQRLHVPKSTLSNWLRDIELTDSQNQRIYDKNIKIRKMFVSYNKLKRAEAIERKSGIFLKAQQEVGYLTKRELKLIGAALYWAEGSKSVEPGMAIFANSDPAMVVLIMRWFRGICKVPEHKFRLKVQSYDKEKVAEHELFWSKLTGISLEQFIKPYIKQSKYSKLRRGNILPYGTLHVRIADVNLLSKILGWINGFRASSSS